MVVYKFYWEDDEQQLVVIKSPYLSGEQLKSKVLAILNRYRNANPREYNMPEFLACLRREGIKVDELNADEEVYF